MDLRGIITHTTKSNAVHLNGSGEMSGITEHNAKLKYLHTKPVCILILGLPSSGKTTLAKRLCDKWKMQLVNATELIKEYIETNTEFGRYLTKLLTDGKSIEEEIVLKIIEEKLDSPECAHYGYVLDDFPTYGQTNLSPEQQIQMLLSLKIKPDIIVHIVTSDGDLQEHRKGLRIDPEDGEVYCKRNYTPEQRIQEEPQEPKFPSSKAENTEAKDTDEKNVDLNEDENLDEEAMEEEEIDPSNLRELSHPDFIKLDNYTKERLVIRCEDMDEFKKIDDLHYKTHVKNQISCLIGRTSPLNVIEIDGNWCPTEMLYHVLSRLQAMNLYPAISPIRFFPAMGEEEDVPEEMETEELFKVLAVKNMPGPRHRWQISRWNRFCPVALSQGKMLYGKPEFSVGLLGQIFCIANIENFTAFMRNPRPYLLEPNPRPPVRLAIVGPTASGKSTLVHLLAEVYNAPVIDLTRMLKAECEAVMQKRLEDVERDTLTAVIEEVQKRYDSEMENLRTNRKLEESAERISESAVEQLEKDAVNNLVQDLAQDEEETAGEGQGEQFVEGDRVDVRTRRLSSVENIYE